MDSYISRLNHDIAERRAKREASMKADALQPTSTPPDPLADLRVRITNWHRNLADEMRLPYWHMDALVQVFRCTPQALGVALDQLGWTRRRTWAKGRPYRNRWYGPAIPDTIAPCSGKVAQ